MNGTIRPDGYRQGHTDEEILKIARKANQAVFFRYLSIVSVVGLLVVGLIAGKASDKAAEASQDVLENQIANCETSVQPGGVRYIVAQGIKRDIQRSKLFDIRPEAVADAFGVSLEAAKAGLAQADKDQRRQIDELLDVDCSSGRVEPADTK